MKFISKIFLLIIIALLASQCAQPGTLTGGPRDTAAPQLDAAASSPNFQTNFEKKDIKLVFDEYLKLNKPFQEVMVSPPLEFTPKIELKNKAVFFKFDEKEKLRENATYTINFGKAVQDLTEGNEVKDLKYVFSTGDFIDSLEVSGVVKEALTGKGVEDAIVMLYDNLADSVVRKELPFYFGRTDKSGKFTITNVRADTFKVVALKESFTNYKFDNSAESIGFLPSPIVVTDSTNTSIEMSLFEEAAPTRIVQADSSQYGKLKLIFNDLPEIARIDYQAKGIDIVRQNVEDSLMIWHNTAVDRDWNLFVTVDTLIDTFLIKGVLRDSFIKKQKLTLVKSPTEKILPLNPIKPLKIEWSEPIKMIDTSKLLLSFDSLKKIVTPIYTIDSLEPSNLLVQVNWLADTIYTFQILPEAVTGIRGTTFKDTAEFKYKPLPAIDFGDITLNVRDSLQKSAYIIELLFKGENKVGDFNVSSSDTLVVKKFTGMPAGNYSVRITEDRNGNGRWDTGNYDRKEQPERQKVRAIEELRAGWEVDVELDLSNFFE